MMWLMVDIDAYAARIRPLLPLATQAYGRRDTISPAHDASREYTKILCEYVAEGGSLPKLADSLGVAYAGLRRRVTNAQLPPVPRVERKRYSDEEYTHVTEELTRLRASGTDQYHDRLLELQENGYSFTRITRELGLKSGYPLYYGADRARARRDTK